MKIVLFLLACVLCFLVPFLIATWLIRRFAPRRRGQIIAANETTTAVLHAWNAIAGSESSVVTESNADKRTARLFVPFGDFGPTKGLDNRDGKTKPTLQRFDIEAANAIVAGLNSMRGTVARKLRLIPIYEGHPDVPGLESTYRDRSSKGWIVGANVGNLDGKDGLFFDAEMTPAGMRMILDEEFAFNSPRWAMAPLTAANEAQQVARPTKIISFGLTNTPFIEGALTMANDAMSAGADSSPFVETGLLAQMLGMSADSPLAEVFARIASLVEMAGKIAAGSRLVDEATWKAQDTMREQLDAAMTKLTAAEAAVTNEKQLATQAAAELATLKTSVTAANDASAAATTERDQLKAQIEAANVATNDARAEVATLKQTIEAANAALASARRAHAEAVVVRAIEGGRLLLADKDRTIAEIVAANCAADAIARVENARPVVKTGSELGAIGARKAGAASSQARVARALEMKGDFLTNYLSIPA